MINSPAFLLIALFGIGDGDFVRVDVTADTWVSGVGKERDGNNGAATRLKLKSHQEFSLLDIDADAAVSALRGRVVRSVTLHLRSTGDPRLLRVTVGATSSFREGTGTNYEPQPGDSSFRRFSHPDVPWKGGLPQDPTRDGDICDVLFGPRQALWGSADASAPDADGWQAIAVDPRVFAARIHGISGGFVAFDDTGTEWKRDGETFERNLFPNRFVYSRDQNAASAPYFTVEVGTEDREPPFAPLDLRREPETASLPAGEAIVSWSCPEDRGASGVLGFRLEGIASEAIAKRMPIAGKVGNRLRLHLRPGDLPSGQLPSEISIRALDASGNLGEAATVKLSASTRPATPLPPDEAPGEGPPGPLPRLGKVEVFVIDELDKVRPGDGHLVPDHDDRYRSRNHLWDASSPRIDLDGAKGEAVAFQVVFQGEADVASMALDFEQDGVAEVAFGRVLNVESRDGPMPDPVVPLSSPARVTRLGPGFTSVLVELQIPTGATSGSHAGRLVIASGADRLDIPFHLNIWNFTLPDVLTFLPEMNCYGLPANERDFYRLAHRHRTYLNRVPYSHRGAVSPGCAPAWDGATLDWSAWDARFGPLLDGSAFADLPRGGVPVDGFYLPLFENWPTPMEGHYDGGYWADRAISADHRRAFVEVTRQIAEHVRGKGWDLTIFQGFFNGKTDFKVGGWSRGTSPWLLDEPANFQDFWALRYFGELFHEGINQAPPGSAKLAFRCDISRPQWQRDVLDDVLDLNVIGGAFREYRPLVLDRKERLGQVVIEYGGANPIESSNVQPAAWCVDAWSLGADGVLPWQTIGTRESWDKADELSLFYPGKDGGPPVASLRLKSFRRGQQDAEYLNLYALATGQPRSSVAAEVRRELKVSGERKANAAIAEDAGRIDYGTLAPADLWTLRTRIGRGLSRLHPEPAPPRSPWQFPERHPLPVGARFLEP